MNRVRTLSAAGAVMALAAGIALPTQSASAAPPQLAIEKREYVSKATGKTKITQWVDTGTGKVVAQATGGLGDQVNLITGSDGDADEYGVEIVPDDPTSDAEAERMAAELTPEVRDERRQGAWDRDQMVELPEQASDNATPPTGVVNRAAPFGLTPSTSITGTGKVFAESCTWRDGDEVYIYGCFQRRNLPDGSDYYRHVMDSSWSTGHHKGTFGSLQWIKTRHNYRQGHSSTLLLDAKPKYTKDVGSCYDWKVGFEKYGITATAGAAICPDEISPNVENQFYMHGWFGGARKDGTWVGSPGHSHTRVQQGYKNGFKFTLVAMELDCSLQCNMDYTDA